jgi:putative transposase
LLPDISGMTAYRRLRRPGATYFFTLCLEERGATTLVDNIDLLRDAYARTTAEFPVLCQAMVVLPDHLHAIWSEPDDSVHYSERWRRIKARFSHGLEGNFAPSPSKRAKRERGVWQRRFWEHMIREPHHLEAAVAYCAWNPVKHGLVSDPENWPYSSWTRRMGSIAHPAGAMRSIEREGVLIPP